MFGSIVLYFDLIRFYFKLPCFNKFLFNFLMHEYPQQVVAAIKAIRMINVMERNNMVGRSSCATSFLQNLGRPSRLYSCIYIGTHSLECNVISFLQQNDISHKIGFGKWNIWWGWSNELVITTTKRVIFFYSTCIFFYYYIRLQESIVTVPYYFFPTIFAGTITCCSSQVAIELVAWQEWIWAWSSWQCWMNLFLGRLSVIKMLMCSRNSATQDKHITASPVQRWRRETATRFPMLQVMEQRKWAWLFTSWRVLLADHTRPYHLAAVHGVLLCLEKLVVNSFQAKKKTTLR